mgnify:CR=1 FL=1
MGKMWTKFRYHVGIDVWRNLALLNDINWLRISIEITWAEEQEISENDFYWVINIFGILVSQNGL